MSPFAPQVYSQADIGNKLSQATVCLSKNYLQQAMYALNDALGMITSIHPEFAKLIAWKDGEGLRSGLPSGTFKKASINQQIIGAVLAIGRGDYSRAVEGIVKAIRMLVWLGETKNKALVVTHSPAERQTEGL